MSPERKSKLIRWIILALVAAVLFILLSPILYRPRTQWVATYTFHQPDVSVEFLPEGAERIRVDAQEETIPKEQLESSPLYQEAWRRLRERSGFGTHYFELRWIRVIRFWLPPVLLLYLILFKWWPPRTDYLMGPRL